MSGINGCGESPSSALFNKGIEQSQLARKIAADKKEESSSVNEIAGTRVSTNSGNATEGLKGLLFDAYA
jgi:hypothetical protein